MIYRNTAEDVMAAVKRVMLLYAPQENDPNLLRAVADLAEGILKYHSNVTITSRQCDGEITRRETVTAV